MRNPVIAHSFVAVLLTFAAVCSAQSKSATPNHELPTFTGTIRCEKGQSDVAVVAALGSSQVIGKLKCSEEVVVITNAVTLSKTNGGLAFVPESVQYYSTNDQEMYSHIAFGTPKSEGWTKAKVDVSPNQSYEILLLGKASSRSAPTKLIYFGDEDRSETPDDVLKLAKQWGTDSPCSNWKATIIKQQADYQILFSTAGFTLIGKRGEVLYTGGMGVLHMANGNPDGSGVNLCKMTR